MLAYIGSAQNLKDFRVNVYPKKNIESNIIKFWITLNIKESLI